MIPKFLKGIAAAALCVVVTAPGARAQLFGGSFFATPSAFSPNGDGNSDVTLIRFSLSDTAMTLSLVVFEADSVSPVDTLIAPRADSTLGLQSVTWDGQRWDGTPAAEGLYLVTLTGRGVSGPDTTLSVPVFVDITPPTLRVTGVSPATYAPGVGGAATVLDVTFVVTDVSPVFPARVPDELQVTITSPNGSAVAPEDLEGRISYDPPLYRDNPPAIAVDGVYFFKWNASTQTGLRDGDYRIDLVIVDSAGFADTDTAFADFDIDPPAITYTNFADGANVSVVPDTLRGWALDRSGINTLRVKYRPSGPYHPVVASAIVADTAFFAIPLADSILIEGSHQVTVRATDGLGRVTAAAIGFTFDATSPGAPKLEPFSGAWHASTFPVRGTFPPGAEFDGTTRIFRNGVVVDSLFTFLETTFERTIPLVAGVNTIQATYSDAANNESPPSNTLLITFDDGSGLFMPVPFRPNDEFIINTAQPTPRVEVRVYDLRGDFVIALESNQLTPNHTLAWHGRNGSGVSVKKGPFVAVATIEYPDGTRTRQREIFLYEPRP